MHPSMLQNRKMLHPLIIDIDSICCMLGFVCSNYYFLMLQPLFSNVASLFYEKNLELDLWGHSILISGLIFLVKK